MRPKIVYQLIHNVIEHPGYHCFNNIRDQRRVESVVGEAVKFRRLNHHFIISLFKLLDEFRCVGVIGWINYLVFALTGK